jgi:hypothetical protein
VEGARTKIVRQFDFSGNNNIIPRGGKKWKFQMKQFVFPHSTNFKLLSQIRENSVNNCNFLYFIIFILEAVILITCSGHRKTWLRHWLWWLWWWWWWICSYLEIKCRAKLFWTE